MAATTKTGSLSRIDKTFLQCRSQLVKLPKVLVITCPFACQHCVQGMVKVVVPLAIQSTASFGYRSNDSYIVQVALSNHMNKPAQPLGLSVHDFGQFTQNVTSATVEDAMDGVQPESVNVKLSHPIESIIDEVCADFVAVSPVVIDRAPPRSSIPVREIGAEVTQIISFRSEVVIHDIQYDGDA